MPPYEAEAIAARLIAGVETLSGEDDGELLPLGLSLGAAVYTPGEPLHAFIARADAQLYQAKARGGGCVAWASE